MLKIRRALISVSDKTGLVELATVLQDYGVEILSTGGTAKLLRENGIPAREVSDYTGFPEMLDGRVKTLHPKIHGGLLAVRRKEEHMQSLSQQGIGLIDMVVVNLYPFEKTVAKPGVVLEEAIENIDIGGPSMLRSAAKNAESVAVVCNPARYPQIISELRQNNGSLNPALRRALQLEVFRLTSRYDQAIQEYLSRQLEAEGAAERFPQTLSLRFERVQALRYGENPHQKAAFYRAADAPVSLADMKQLWGKELSYNNILDLQAAVGIIQEFSSPAVVFIKHNNPCGVAENASLQTAYRQAWKCDALSAFGGIVGINRPVERALARLIAQSGFLECIVAPAFSKEALVLLQDKKNLRLLEFPAILQRPRQDLDFKRVCGGLLLQDEDTLTLEEAALRVVTKKKPTKAQRESLLFAWKVAKHVKSNAIILARGTRTVGIGAGQMSRVDSVFISTKKAGTLARGAVLASDAFFPKEDAVRLAARFKIKAIIQPGGSIADEKIIKTADACKIPMLFTGIRHFRH